MRTKTKIALGILAVFIFFIAIGIIAEPEGEPVRIGELYRTMENMDADKDLEMMYWLTLLDKDGNQVSSDGKIRVELGPGGDPGRYWCVKEVHKSDFKKAKVGLGAFEREVFLYANYIDYEDLKTSRGFARMGNLKEYMVLTFELPDGTKLQTTSKSL